jgi:hypothetical protein
MALARTDNSASAIWQRTIEPAKALPAAAARAFLRLRLSAADLKRVDELAAKARAGSLRQEEEQELEHYRTVGTALEFLKSRARLSLKKASR